MRPNWHDHAACRGGTMIDVFFPRGMTTQRDIQRANLICTTCPVRQQCADSGRSEPHGIWAGEWRRRR